MYSLRESSVYSERGSAAASKMKNEFEQKKMNFKKKLNLGLKKKVKVNGFEIRERRKDKDFAKRFLKAYFYWVLFEKNEFAIF